MANKYEIRITKEAAKELRNLPQWEQSKIRLKIQNLANSPRPHGSVKLAGFDNRYRVRQGDYRVIYEIFDDEVVVQVVRVAHRREVYDR